MYFRFASGIILVVLIALVGVGLEKETLSLRREVSRQHFRTEILVENKAKLRWECEQLGAPQRLIDVVVGRGCLAHSPVRWYVAWGGRAQGGRALAMQAQALLGVGGCVGRTGRARGQPPRAPRLESAPHV